MRTIIFGCAAATLIACGGRTDAKQGLEGPTVGETSADYPVGDYGWEVGDVVPNVAFLGYSHIDPTTTIDLAKDEIGSVHVSDYYDPTGERGLTYLVVAVQVAWCPPSNEQDDMTNGGNSMGWTSQPTNYAMEYAVNGVRFMTLLEQGYSTTTDATVADLRSWVALHSARTTQALVSSDEMSLDIVGPAWPYNMIVDLRTMRIVATWLGFDYQNRELRSLISTRIGRMADH